MTSPPTPEPELTEMPRAIVPRNLALKIERMGFIPLKHRLISVLVFVALCALAAVGFARLKVDDSLSQLFRSDTAEFKTYEDVTQNFPATEFDVLIVVEGAKLLDRPSIQKLRDLVIDLQLIDGTRGVISLFSARQPPENGQIPAPLFPNPLPEGAEYQALVQRVMSNEIIRGKLLSEDGKLALIVLALDPSAARDKLSGVISEVRETVNEHLADTGLNGELSGVPVMQLETRNAIERDRLVYNALGFLAGCLIAVLFFRRVSFMIIAAAPPLAAILLALGALGWLDFRLNIFLNVMTPLIMVISFSDSMQLTFAARDRLIAGDDKFTAFRNALLIAGPACVLTHATAGISFIALQFSKFRPDPDFRRSRAYRHAHRHGGGGDDGAVAWRLAHSQRGRLSIERAGHGQGARRFAPVLRMDRPSHGRASGSLHAGRPARRCRAFTRLSAASAALPAGRSGAGPRAGRCGQPAARRETDRRQSD